MKLGVNLWVWSSPFDLSRDRSLLTHVRMLGAEVVEVALEDDALFEASALRRALDEEGLACSAVGLFGPARDLSVADLATRQRGVAYARDCLDRCAESGIALFTGAVLGVGGREVLTKTDRQQRYERAAEHLRELGAYAIERNVRFVVEVLNRYETNLITTAAEARDLIDLVAHPGVGIHLDTFHMGIEEADMHAAIRQAGDRLWHVHASESHRGQPGTGLTRWDQVGAGLRELNYDGWVVIESFNPAGRIAPLACLWRPLAPSPDTLARDGLDFLKLALGG